MCRYFVTLFLVLPAVGCGGLAVAPVSGRITLDGKPLANAHVSFQPVTSKKGQDPGPGSVGVTDQDGRYSLRIPIREVDGAIVGNHRVFIMVPRPKGEQGKENAKEEGWKQPVPRRYNEESTLTFQVFKGNTNEADFELVSGKSKIRPSRDK